VQEHKTLDKSLWLTIYYYREKLMIPVTAETIIVWQKKTKRPQTEAQRKKHGRFRDPRSIYLPAAAILQVKDGCHRQNREAHGRRV
jgi:hypothetical protein